MRGYAALAALASLVWLMPHVLHVRRLPDAGDPVFSAWRIARVAHQLTHDPRHLFDGNIFHPTPLTLTYSDATLLQGLIAAPFISAGGDPLVVSNVLFLSSFPLSALAFFFASWRLTSDPRASCVAGVLGALYPFKTEHYSHLELQFFFFAPLAVVALLRMLAAPRASTGFALGAAVTAQWLSSMYFGMMLLVFLVPFALAAAVAWAVRPSRQIALASAAAIAVVCVGLSVLAIPYMSSRSARGERAVTVVAEGSAVPRDYLRPHPGLASYQWISRVDNKPERALLPGITPVALAAAGAVPPLTAFTVGALSAAALAFDASLGTNGVIYAALYRLVTPVRSMRVPARFAAMVGTGLILLAAFGGGRILALTKSLRSRNVVFVVLMGAVMMDLRPNLKLRDYWPSIPPVYASVTPRMVLAEFPLDHDIDYMYFSTRHWARLINGYSGFTPEAYVQLKAYLLQEFPSPKALELLRLTGATHITVNCAFYRPPSRCEPVLKTLDNTPDVVLVATASWQHATVRLYRYR